MDVQGMEAVHTVPSQYSFTFQKSYVQGGLEQ
jgi:hypothetical protein